ncbi:MAG: SGNH/GDSL hydrolase family protein [Nakamurella sp.]
MATETRTANSADAAFIRSRTMRHALRAALGFGAVTAGLVGAAGASWATLAHQARDATGTINEAARAASLAQGLPDSDGTFRWKDLPPNGTGVYFPDGSGPCRSGPSGTAILTMLGDSTSVGYGCTATNQLPGVLLAKAAAASLGRPVRLRSHGVVGSVSAGLAAQLAPALGGSPDVVVIMVGANDVRDRVPPGQAAAQLEHAVRTLHSHGIAVVVGTCPDLGVIVPIRQPLRRIAGVWSRRLARMQGRVVERTGGVAVALDRLVSPDFYGRPDLFCVDGFHPSALGYAKAMAALSPAVIDALR